MKNINKIYSILENGTTYPPVSIEYIENIEKQLNIIFPKEFKIFYTQISNGFCLDDYTLYNIDEIVYKAKEKYLNKKFQLTNTLFWGDENLPPIEVEYGNIEVSDMGDGMTWCLIVNSNLLYGTMWFFTEWGIQKCKNDFDFLEWFELWSQRKDNELFD